MPPTLAHRPAKSKAIKASKQEQKQTQTEHCNVCQAKQAKAPLALNLRVTYRNTPWSNWTVRCTVQGSSMVANCFLVSSFTGRLQLHRMARRLFAALRSASVHTAPVAHAGSGHTMGQAFGHKLDPALTSNQDECRHQDGSSADACPSSQ